MPTSQFSEETLAALPEDFSVEIAGLSDAAQAQVIDAVQAAEDNGTVADLNIDHTISDAQVADAGRENVEALHQQQADAASSGDFDHAHDLAQQAGYELREVADHGGEADAQIVQADRDVSHLDEAHVEQQTAHDNATAAANSYAAGDTVHGDMSADLAANHATAASEAGGAADQGGHYGDHAYDSASSVGAETTTE